MLAYFASSARCEADRGGHVTGKWNLELVGLGHQRVEDIAGHARMNLQQVVAGLLLRDDRVDGHLLRGCRLAIERRP